MTQASAFIYCTNTALEAKIKQTEAVVTKKGTNSTSHSNLNQLRLCHIGSKSGTRTFYNHKLLFIREVF